MGSKKGAEAYEGDKGNGRRTSTKTAVSKAENGRRCDYCGSFLCYALISQGFYVHERNTGMLILMDALEQAQTGRENTDTVEMSERWGNRALSAYYRCGGCKIEIVKRGTVLTGSFKHRNGKTGGNVQMKLFEPERFLRMVRAGGI